MPYRWRNYGRGVDDDGVTRAHPGEVWMKKSPVGRYVDDDGKNVEAAVGSALYG